MEYSLKGWSMGATELYCSVADALSVKGSAELHLGPKEIPADSSRNRTVMPPDNTGTQSIVAPV